MNGRACRLKAAIALGAAALALAGPFAFAGGTYRSPPRVKVYGGRAAATAPTSYYIPPGAPVDRTYTWYAPPEGYEVLLAGTPAEPAVVTAVGPDGQERTFRVTGPVVMRPRSYVVRSGSR